MDGNSLQKGNCQLENLPDSLDQWPPLDELLRRGKLLRKATSWGNTDTYVLRTNNGTEYLLKTFARQPKLIRIFLGGISIKNEYNTLKFLESNGFQHAPRAYKLLPKGSILMEFISDGAQLGKSEKYLSDDYPSVEFFHALIAAMRDLHEMGVSHGDFRRANILRKTGEVPILIDWATAIVKYRDRKRFFWRWPLYQMMVKSDQYSLASITESYYPELINSQLQGFLTNLPWYLRLGRFLRQKFYRHFIKELAGKKKQSDNSIKR
jgi:predicted Ser/Thr protein kinase